MRPALATLILFFASTTVCAETYWVRPKNTLTCQTTCAGASYADAFNGISDISWGTSAGQVGPGDTLKICGDFDRTTEGRTNLFDLTVSGTAEARITITGECPEGQPGRLWAARRIDTGAWSSAGGGAYQTPWSWTTEFAAEGPFGAEVLLETKTSLAEVQATPGSAWRDTTNNILYYHPISMLKTVWANWTSAFDLHGSDYITITNLVLRGGTSGEHGVIELTGTDPSPAEHVWVKNSNIGFGVLQLIECYRGCSNLVVENNVMHDASTGTYLCRGAVNCTGIVLRENNLFSGRDLTNIYYAPAADRHALGGQNMSSSVIERNHIHDWAGDGINIWTAAGKRGEDNIVRYNTIERLDDVDSQNWHNGIMLSGANEALRADSTSGWQIYGNTIRALEGGKSATDEGTAIRLKAAVATDGTKTAVYGNTISDVANGIYLREIAGDYRLGALIRDNTIEQVNYYIMTDSASDGSQIDIDIDHNRYYGNGQFRYRTTVGNLQTWQTSLGGCPLVENDCKSQVAAERAFSGRPAQCEVTP